MLMSKLVEESGRVIAIEAFPKTCATLGGYLTLNDVRNVEVKEIAVADRCGMLDMIVPDPMNSGMTTTVIKSQERSQNFCSM